MQRRARRKPRCRRYHATYAERLGHSEDHDLLSQTLSEEKEADQKLNKIAKGMVNKEAATA